MKQYFATEHPHETRTTMKRIMTTAAGIGLAVVWCVAASAAEPLEKVDPNKDNSGITRESPWLTLDPQTGLLSGTPKAPGVNVLIVSANVKDGKMVLCDARSVIVVAE